MISLVIPAYNETKYLGKLLASVSGQNFYDYEIIVVDNNSTDDTAKIAEQFGAKVIKENRQGVAFARQAGFARAQGDIIATTDADTVLPSDWLAKIAAKFGENPRLVAYGGAL